jgi:prepilin-type N-terminal cleavage/methylation domain-containing protein
VEERKGFTLIELMIVILIIGILAAAAIPLMRGRVDSAKWTEGKSGLGRGREKAKRQLRRRITNPTNSGLYCPGPPGRVFFYG